MDIIISIEDLLDKQDSVYQERDDNPGSNTSINNKESIKFLLDKLKDYIIDADKDWYNYDSDEDGTIEGDCDQCGCFIKKCIVCDETKCTNCLKVCHICKKYVCEYDSTKENIADYYEYDDYQYTCNNCNNNK